MLTRYWFLAALVATHTIIFLLIRHSPWMEFLAYHPFDFVTANWLSAPWWLAVASMISYQFIHAHWEHLISNMFFLVFCSGCLLHYISPYRISAIMLLSGVFGAFIHTYSTTLLEVSLIGCSGAIAGLMGYIVIRIPQHILTVPLIRLQVPVWGIAATWVVMQLLNANRINEYFNNIAYFAHMGGIIAGMGIAWYDKINKNA